MALLDYITKFYRSCNNTKEIVNKTHRCVRCTILLILKSVLNKRWFHFQLITNSKHMGHICPNLLSDFLWTLPVCDSFLEFISNPMDILNILPVIWHLHQFWGLFVKKILFCVWSNVLTGEKIFLEIDRISMLVKLLQIVIRMLYFHWLNSTINWFVHN